MFCVASNIFQAFPQVVLFSTILTLPVEPTSTLQIFLAVALKIIHDKRFPEIKEVLSDPKKCD